MLACSGESSRALTLHLGVESLSSFPLLARLEPTRGDEGALTVSTEDVNSGPPSGAVVGRPAAARPDEWWQLGEPRVVTEQRAAEARGVVVRADVAAAEGRAASAVEATAGRRGPCAGGRAPISFCERAVVACLLAPPAPACTPAAPAASEPSPPLLCATGLCAREGVFEVGLVEDWACGASSDGPSRAVAERYVESARPASARALGEGESRPVPAWVMRGA